jgi:hypothetical protein
MVLFNPSFPFLVILTGLLYHIPLPILGKQDLYHMERVKTMDKAANTQVVLNTSIFIFVNLIIGGIQETFGKNFISR